MEDAKTRTFLMCSMFGILFLIFICNKVRGGRIEKETGEWMRERQRERVRE